MKELENTTEEPKSENETETEYYARKKKKVVVQHTYSFFDVQYLANISTGTPGQKFRVVLDYASGNIGEDTVKFLGRKRTRIRMKKIEFGQASTLSPAAEQSLFEGIIELAFRPIVNDNMTPPLIFAMHRKLLAKPIFSVHSRAI
uniref:Peptidase A1 domain-containing protein n=1 Tax=Strongyloides papillosus TaxID=174720 RepID=A0A0N5BHL8_STREA